MAIYNLTGLPSAKIPALLIDHDHDSRFFTKSGFNNECKHVNRGTKKKPLKKKKLKAERKKSRR